MMGKIKKVFWGILGKFPWEPQKCLCLAPLPKGPCLAWGFVNPISRVKRALPRWGLKLRMPKKLIKERFFANKFGVFYKENEKIGQKSVEPFGLETQLFW